MNWPIGPACRFGPLGSAYPLGSVRPRVRSTAGSALTPSRLSARPRHRPLPLPADPGDPCPARSSPAPVRWGFWSASSWSTTLSGSIWSCWPLAIALDPGTLAAAEPIRPPPACSAALRRPLCASPTGQQRVLDVARRRWCRGATCAATVAGRRFRPQAYASVVLSQASMFRPRRRRDGVAPATPASPHFQLQQYCELPPKPSPLAWHLDVQYDPATIGW
jgi:hypothetical protein